MDFQTLMECADPIVGQMSRSDRAFTGRMHSHRRAQLICTVSSAADIRMRSRSWHLGPGEAAWIPGDVEHSVSAGAAPMFRSIYVRPDLAAKLPVAGGVLRISAFLSELTSRLAALYHGQGDASLYPHLVELVFSELDNGCKPRCDLPMPTSPRLLRICQTLSEDPGNRRGLHEWAALTGTSRRFLERRFQHETGMSFAEWRQRCRVQAAMPLLEANHPIQQIAWKLGYESPSAFSAMFRRVTGVAPTMLRPQGVDDQQSITMSSRGIA